MPNRFALGLTAWGVLLLWLVGPVSATAQSLTVTSNLTGDWIDRRFPVELRLSRALEPDEGEIAILVGDTDVTDLFSQDPTLFRYSGALPLPAGSVDLSIFLVTPDNLWEEIDRLSLQVLTRGGFETVDATPTIDVGFKSQAAEGHDPPDSGPPRERYVDGTLQGSVRTELVRNGVTWRNSASIVGSTFGREALRFSQLREDAPNVDLSSYLIEVEGAVGRAALGHQSTGTNRHLVNRFSSRGVSFTVPIGPQVEASFSALNGNRIVGWGNFLGLTTDNNRIYVGQIAAELVPSRRGALRVEAAVLNGSILTSTGFNQGAITDAEKSNGFGFRVAATDAARRFRLDSGYTRSRFTNPDDPLLSQGASLVEVRRTTRDAQYLELGVDVLQNYALTETQTATVTVQLRHERVDPLFRSVGAYSQADRLFNQVEVQGVFGQATVQAVHARSEDNLDEIPSILKTLTRQSRFNARVPLTDDPAEWLPTLTYSVDTTHQFGDSLPIGGGFNESHVPDQFSSNQLIGVEWQQALWQASYQWGRSNQDNRQPGRETADLKNFTNLVTIGVSPGGQVNLTGEMSFDSAVNRQQVRTDRTRRFALYGDWRSVGGLGVNGSLSTTA